MIRYKHILTVAAAITAACSVSARPQIQIDEPMLISEIAGTEVAGEAEWISVVDSLLTNCQVPDSVVSFSPLPRSFFLPAVFNSYQLPPEQAIETFKSDYSGNPALRWAEDAEAVSNRTNAILQRLFVTNPQAVRYNVGMLPEPPKEYTAVVDPQEHTITIREVGLPTNIETTVEATEVKKIHWINTFNASMQFSQAYVSPNWYQGGNNNLNLLMNLNYNIKLNQKYHPNLLFETTVQYKLGLYSTPDDPYREYNISEDLFQFNSTFGVKAAGKWFYTVNAQFKTQFLNSYKANTTTMRSAFLSPGELNVGLGMTFNTENKKKTFKFDASISPLSYNMMICTNKNIDETAYGISPGEKTVSNIGSSLECKMMLKITHNITLNSRLFAFTNYDRAYADLENTLVFEINKYLTAQIFAHLRYDTDTPKVADESWKKLQVKEILSLGFAYKFATN